MALNGNEIKEFSQKFYWTKAEVGMVGIPGMTFIGATQRSSKPFVLISTL